ncbi:MAG TPA: DUF2188 domain-containing protein [Gammaproteobacteria bacterium]|nr:DUF2188 domain-containing protein [Gammaproteobacteria bacterium]
MNASNKDYPEMAHLDPDTRRRAAALARQLSDEGYPEPEAVRTAIQRMTAEQRETADEHPADAEAEKYVTPHEEGWAVVSPTGEHQMALYATKAEALEKAREIARKEHARVHVVDKDEHVEDASDSDGNGDGG